MQACPPRSRDKRLELLAHEVIGVGLMIHQELGPGLLESSYEAILFMELERRGMATERQLELPVIWKGINTGTFYRVDLVVDHSLLIELKSVETLAPVHSKQVLTYLRLMNLPLGLLLNFGSVTFRQGIQRIVND